MPLSRTGLSARVGGLFASHFLGFGLFLPFFPLVLEARGLSVDEIGFVLGLGTIVRIGSSPVLANLSDRSGKRRLSIFVYSLCAGGFLGAFAASSGVTSAWITIAGLMIFWAPIVPLSDAYALDVQRNTGADYARMRLWGSVGFVVANIGGGWLASAGSDQLIVVALVVSVLSTGFVAILLPRQEKEPSAADGLPVSSGKVFREGWFLAALVIGGLLQATHAAFYGFGTLFWVNAGINEFAIGGLWAIGVVAEIGLFFVAKRLSLKAGPLQFMMIAAAGSILRWVIFPFATELWQAAALQVLHGLSFGAAHLGSVAFLAKVVPQKWSATGQGLLSTSSGILLAIGLAVCGPLYELDPAYPFWVMALLALIALLALAAMRPVLASKLSHAAV